MIVMVTEKEMSTLTAVLVLVGLLGRTFRGCASVLNLIHTEKHDERQKKGLLTNNVAQSGRIMGISVDDKRLMRITESSCDSLSLCCLFWSRSKYRHFS